MILGLVTHQMMYSDVTPAFTHLASFSFISLTHPDGSLPELAVVPCCENQ